MIVSLCLVYRLLRTNLICTCFVSTVSDADGDVRKNVLPFYHSLVLIGPKLTIMIEMDA